MAIIWLVKYVTYISFYTTAKVVTSLIVIKLSKGLPWLDKRDNSLTTWDSTHGNGGLLELHMHRMILK